MAFLNVANNAESTLASGMTADAVSLTVATGEGAKFPSGNFHITIDDEILKCTSRSGDVFTVARAQEGTQAAAHSAGTAVQLRWTAGYVQEIHTAISALQGVNAGPFFKVTQTVQQELPAAWTVMQFNNVVFDTHNAWDAGNHRWVCPAAGYYIIFGLGGIVNLPDTKRIAVSVFVNGGEVGRIFDSVVGGTSNVAGGGGVFTYLNQNDTVQLKVYHNNDSSLYTIATNFTCQMSIARMSG